MIRRLSATLLIAILVMLSAGTASALQATLQWSVGTVTGHTEWRVERRDGLDTAPWVSQGTVAAATTTFNQSGLVLGTRYSYRVFPINTLGDGTATNIAIGTPEGPQGQPGGLTIIFAP
jgi:hypothetical protein